MDKSFQIAVLISVAVLALVGVWLLLDGTGRCHLLHGRNICNFYEVMDIAFDRPSVSDFDRMMELCGGMSHVPKKDSCFQLVAETFSRIDLERAIDACNEIQEITDQVGNTVYTTEGCLERVEG